MVTHVLNLKHLAFYVIASLGILTASCGSAPTDIRTVIPGDAILYLETQDLGKALTAITDNDAFRNAAKTQPDLSVLNGIKMGVAVTGFETKEETEGEGSAVLNFQPRFVAVAETNAWNYQAIAFAENKLGEFINEIYGGGVELERAPKHDGDYFVWTADDGRKAYGLVIGSLIFFGNDETAIEKCMAVRKGEADSMAKNANLPSGDFLASGLMSKEGIGQFANIAGIQMALGAGEEEEVRAFIARVMPEIMRNSVEQITWTASRSELGIEDRLTLKGNAEIQLALSNGLAISGTRGPDRLDRAMPLTASSFTRYDLKDPQLAWRSVLLSAQRQTDPKSGAIISAFSNSLFEPYGVDNAELLLANVRSKIYTVAFDDSGDRSVAVMEPKDVDAVKKTLAKEFEIGKAPEQIGSGQSWIAKDDGLRAIFIDGLLIVGNDESVMTVYKAIFEPNADFNKHRLYLPFTTSDAVSVSISRDDETAKKIAQAFSEANNEAAAVIYSLTETRINKDFITRRIVSDFGLIGSIVEQFATEK